MADKKITLSIEGQEAVCNFGVNYFYKHFNEATGIDMLVEGLKGIETTKMFDLVPAIYFSGYRAECSIKKQEVKIKKEDFEHYVLSADEATAAKMVTDYIQTINPSAGEAVAQTENP